jgi:uncharacterized protein (TIGR02118 family)
VYKFFFAGVRKAGMAPDDFRDHWLTTHAGLARQIPGLLHYVVNLVPDRAQTESFPFGGYAEVTYISRDVAIAATESDEARRVAVDEPNLFDVPRCVRFRVDEHVIEVPTRPLGG